MNLRDKYKVGEYFYNPSDDTWVVRIEDADDGSDSWFDCKTQYEAEVVSRLARIEQMLKKDK